MWCCRDDVRIMDWFAKVWSSGGRKAAGGERQLRSAHPPLCCALLALPTVGKSKVLHSSACGHAIPCTSTPTASHPSAPSTSIPAFLPDFLSYSSSPNTPHNPRRHPSFPLYPPLPSTRRQIYLSPRNPNTCTRQSLPRQPHPAVQPRDHARRNPNHHLDEPPLDTTPTTLLSYKQPQPCLEEGDLLAPAPSPSCLPCASPPRSHLSKPSTTPPPPSSSSLPLSSPARLFASR